MDDIIYINDNTEQIVPSTYPDAEPYIRFSMLNDNLCSLFCKHTMERCPWRHQKNCLFSDSLKSLLKDIHQ